MRILVFAYCLLALPLVGLLRPAAPTPQAFVPLFVSDPPVIKGLAFAADWACGDLAGVAWFHSWSEAPPFCSASSAAWFPLTPTGKPAACHSVILFYNEPDFAGYTPTLAAADVGAYRTACPGTHIVLGNVSQYGLAWVIGTLALLPSDCCAVGFHAYCEQVADGCLAVFSAFAAALPGVELWVTESAVFHAYDAPAEVTRLMNGCAAVATHCAWYSNRQTLGDPWAAREFYIYTDAGLTPVGQAFAGWAG